MKKLVTSYTFNAAAKTITASDFSTLDGILLITNVTDHLVIYNFADTTKGGTLAGTTLTLTYDTTAMSNGDALQIFIDDTLQIARETTQSTQNTRIGDLTETAPASDTASSGLNGRLQRIAQRITSLIGLLPAALASTGELKVSIDSTQGVNLNTNSGNVANGVLRVTLATNQATLTNTLGTVVGTGDVAHDAVDSGSPLKVGYQARTSDTTPVANADRVNGIADTLGKQVILQGAVHDLQSNGTATYTNTTAADVIAAAGAGVRIAVTSVLVTNAHATVGTKVEIRDGTTVKILGYATAAGGGFSYASGGRPLFISTANTAVTARCTTTGADVDVNISGYRIAN